MSQGLTSGSSWSIRGCHGICALSGARGADPLAMCRRNASTPGGARRHLWAEIATSPANAVNIAKPIMQSLQTSIQGKSQRIRKYDRWRAIECGFFINLRRIVPSPKVRPSWASVARHHHEAQRGRAEHATTTPADTLKHRRRLHRHHLVQRAGLGLGIATILMCSCWPSAAARE